MAFVVDGFLLVVCSWWFVFVSLLLVLCCWWFVIGISVVLCIGGFCWCYSNVRKLTVMYTVMKSVAIFAHDDYYFIIKEQGSRIEWSKENAF